MRGQRCVRFCVALALLVSLVLGALAPVAAQEEGAGQRLILALYRADMAWTTWAEPHCDVPPDLYVSADASAVERHVQEALAAGIDAFVQTWHGPSVVANPTASNFRMLLEQAAQLGFAAAVQVDLTSPLLDTADEVSGALEALQDDLTRHPGYLMVHGRPVIFFLGQQSLSLASWEALRGRVDPGRQTIWVAEGESSEALMVFDGLYLWAPDRLALPGSLLSRWGSQVRAWEQVNGARRYWAATTMPGYDDRLLVDADQAFVLSRKAGATYRDHWAAADASNPDWILIRSFNEWDHCTYIERSTAFGDSYMVLTAELVSRYRDVAAPATMTPLVPESSATPTQDEPSEPVTPTVAVAETAEPSATPDIPPTLTLMPTVTPFRLATPTPSAVPSATYPSIASRPVPTTPEAGRSVPAGLIGTATPRPRPVVEGDEPRSCIALPLLLTTVCCWGAWRHRNG